jgi:hypothetical protein
MQFYALALADHDGDTANAILTAVGYNISRLLTWLAAPLCLLRLASLRVSAPVNTGNSSALILQAD